MPHVPQPGHSRRTHGRVARKSHSHSGYLAPLHGAEQLVDQTVIDGVVGPGAIPPGTIVGDAAIVPGSISLTPFADTIRPVAIVAVLPSLPDPLYPVGSTVVLTTDGKLYRNVADVWTATVAASEGGIEPVGALPSLPHADYPVNSVVLLTTDGKLYRNISNVWTKAVDGADLIADSVTANAIAAGTITADEIAANTITADEIAANAITATELAADSVTTAKIAAGAITTDELAAGDITLFDADGTTALSPDGFGGAWRRFIQSGMYNSDFATQPPTVGSNLGVGNQMPYWPFTSVGTGSIVARAVTQSSDKAVRFIASSGTNGDQAYIEQIVELASSEKSLSRATIQFSVSGVTFGTGVNPHLWVDWLDSGGAVISAALSASLGTWIDTSPNGGYWDLGAFPAGAVFVRVRFGVRRTATNASTGTLYLHEARIAWAGMPLRFLDATGDQVSFPTLGWIGQEFGRLALKSDINGASEIRLENGDGGSVRAIVNADDEVSMSAPILRLNGELLLHNRAAWMPGRLEGWMAEDLAASQTDMHMGRFAPSQTNTHQRSPIMGRNGRVIGLAWRKSAALSAGTVKLQITISGGASIDVVTLDSGSGNSGFSALGSPQSFTSTQSVAVRLTTDGSYSPATLDYAVDVVVEYEAPTS